MIRFGCRICCLPFYERNMYIEHMKRSHWPREAPYSCCICKYRSSFQRDIFSHFEKVIHLIFILYVQYSETIYVFLFFTNFQFHGELKSLLCPICLDILNSYMITIICRCFIVLQVYQGAESMENYVTDIPLSLDIRLHVIKTSLWEIEFS